MAGREPSYPRLASLDIQGRDLWFLLDLTWGGQTIHLAQRDLVAPTGDQGADVQYHSGLDLGEVEDVLELLSDAPNAKSTDLVMWLEPQIVVKDLLADGHILGSMTGELHVWPDGSTAFQTLIVGRIINTAWDVHESPVTGTIEEAPGEDEARIPPITAKVDTDTWPSHDTNATDEPYITVIGTPGRAEVQPLDPVGSPCHFVNTTGDVLQVSDGDIVGNGAAQSLTIWNESDGTSDPFTVVVTADGRGRTVSTVDITGAPNLTINPGDKYWAIWTGARHGIVDDGKTNALTGAGDLIVWLMRQSALRWDRGRIAAIQPVLNRFVIDTFIAASPDQRIKPWGYIQSELLPILPVSPRIGPNGLYLVLWDYFLNDTAAVAAIEHGRNAFRDGDYQETDIDRVASTISLRYQWAATTNEFEGFAGLSGDDVTLAQDTRYQPSLHMRRARNFYGSNRIKEESTEIVRDASTAGLIVAWWSRAMGAQFVEMDYLVDPVIAARVEPGRSVKVTDADRGFTDRLAIVDSVTWTLDGLMRMGLRMPPVDLGEAG